MNEKKILYVEDDLSLLVLWDETMNAKIRSNKKQTKQQENTCNPGFFMIESKRCDDKKRWSSDTVGM